eukprot:gene7646-9404_t
MLLNWDEQLKRISRDNSAVMQTLNLILTAVFFLVSASLYLYPNDIIQTSIAPITNLWNGHKYELRQAQAAITREDAQTSCQVTLSNGDKGYLATIFTKDEHNFILENELRKEITWIGGYNPGVVDFQNWSWDGWSSSEGNPAVFYDTAKDQCYTYCPWASGEPNYLVNEQYIHLSKDGKVMNNRAGNTGASGNGGPSWYLCEFDSSDKEPHIAPSQTTINGGRIKITNLINFNLDTLLVNLVHTATSQPVTCTDIQKDPNQPNTVTCKLPPGVGAYNVTISDGGGRITEYPIYYQHQSPYLRYVYPPNPVSTNPLIITIAGNNFGNDPAAITVKIGPSLQSCSPISFLSGSTDTITCSLATSIPATSPFLPITFSVYSLEIKTYRVPTYSYENRVFYSLSNLSFTYSKYLELPSRLSSLDGLQPTFAVITKDTNGFQFLSKMVPPGTYNIWQPVSYDSRFSNFLVNTGPSQGAQVELVNQNSNMGLNGDMKIYYQYDTTAPTTPTIKGTTDASLNNGFAAIIQYGGIAPKILNSEPILVPMSGMEQTFTLENFGNKYSVTKVSDGSREFDILGKPAENQIKFKIPQGFAGPKQITVSVDGFVSSNKVQYDYQPPKIDSVDPLPTIGGTTVIKGSNLGYTISSVTIQLGTQTVPETDYNYIVGKEGTEINLKVRGGTGLVNGKLIVGQGDPQSKSADFVIQYNPPIINSVQFENQYQLKIEGVNFGTGPNSNAVVSIGGAEPVTQFVTKSDTQIIFDIPKNARNGVVKVIVNGLESNTRPVVMTPILLSSTSIPVEGGEITVFGDFLSPTDQDGNPFSYIFTSMDPQQNSERVECSFISPNYPYQLKCQINSKYKGDISTLLKVSTTDTSNFSQLSVKYQPPTIEGATSVLQNTGGVVTVTGTNFIGFQLKVSIADIDCTDIQLIDSKKLHCTFNGQAAPGTNGDGLTVKVSMGDLSGSNQVFFYTQNKQCPGQPTPCSGNGDCDTQTGSCRCKDGFDGISCSVEIPPLPPGQEPPPPPAVLPTGGALLQGGKNVNDGEDAKPAYNFSVGITHLREFDIQRKTVKTLSIEKDLKWDQQQMVDENNYYYKGIFPGESVIFELYIKLFKNKELVEFAGETIEMASNSIKYQIVISNYTFDKSTNNLDIVYNSITTKNVKVGCEEMESSTNVDESSGSLGWFEINSGGATMKARFSERMLLDGRIKKSSVIALPLTDELYQAVNLSTTNSPNELSFLTSIVSPYFNDRVVLDPNFGVLVSFYKDDKQGCGTGKKNNWKIPVLASVFSVVGAAAIIVTVIYVVKSKYLRVRILEIKLSRRG